MSEEILELLSSSKLKEFRKGVEMSLAGCGDAACELILDRLKGLNLERSWELATHGMKSLGLNSFAPAREFLSLTWREGEVHSMTSSSAATAYVRVAREDLKDARPVLEIIDHGGFSQVSGALDALGYDKMMPGEEDVQVLLEQCWDFGNDRPRGLTDPRYGLVAACAGWLELARVKEFLAHCMETGDAPVQHVAEKSIQGEYTSLR